MLTYSRCNLETALVFKLLHSYTIATNKSLKSHGGTQRNDETLEQIKILKRMSIDPPVRGIFRHGIYCLNAYSFSV